MNKKKGPRTLSGEEPGAGGSSTRADDGAIVPDKAGCETINKRVKRTLRIGTWNIRTINNGALNAITSDVDKYNIDMLGIAEHRMAGAGHFRPESGGKFIYSGAMKSGQSGVAFYLSRNTENSLLGYNPINDRILSIRIHAKPANITFIQVYAPTSTADATEIEKFYEILKKTTDTAKTRDVVVILGDFNAKIGKNEEENGNVSSFGLGERNERGDRLMDFALENDLIITNTTFKQHPRRLYTWTSPDGQLKNQIDYILVPARWRSSIQNVKTLPGADCGSDHELLSAKIRIKLRKLKKQKPVVRYDVSDISEQYRVEVANRFRALQLVEEEKEPEELANEIRDIMAEAAEKHINKKKKVNQPWISKTTLDLIEERKVLKGMKDKDDRYRLKYKEVKSSYKADKRMYLDRKCAKIEECKRRNDSRGMFEEIKSMTSSYKPRLGVIKDAAGQTLTESEDILGRWREYCEDMYKADSEGGDEDDIVNIGQEEEPEPLREEVEAAIKNLKDGKSPGCDNIQAELIKASGEAGVNIYLSLCRKIWKSRKWPIDWKRAIFIPLPKKGDLQSCSNHRTVSLISHASKIMLKILMLRMKQKLEAEVSRTQAGFRYGRGTRDHIFNLQLLIQKCREVNHDLRICFIDYSKAFDCVRHNALWNILSRMGFGHTITSLIKELYDGQQSAVKLECGTTEWFPVEKGVRQGGVLSPYLFSLYTEDIMRQVQDDRRKQMFDAIKVNGEEVYELRYADDTALISDSNVGIEHLIHTVKDYSEKKGLKLNVKKTKIIDSKSCWLPSDVAVEGENIERVESFEYLGALLDGDGDGSKEIKRRLVMATRKLNSLEKLWKATDNEMKLRVVRACVFPTATYGCEAWTLSKNMTKRINAFEMKCYRKILRVSWTEHRTNESITNELKVTPGSLLRTIKIQKLKYFGHVKRHNSLEKLILEGKIEGKRRQGRPRRRWEDDINEWTKRTVADAGRLANDRMDYRHFVVAATSQPG